MHEHYEKDGYTVISKNPTLADGVTQQMSTEWVLSRLDSCLNESDAQLIRALIQSKSDLVGFRIVNVKKSGEVIIKNLGGLL